MNIDGHPRGGWLSQRVHLPLANWLQDHSLDWLSRRHLRQGQKNLMIIIPRGFGKTTLIPNGLLPWLHLRDPELSCYIGSESLDKAAKFFKPVRELFSGGDPFQRFTQYYGNWYNKNRDWKNEALVHAVRRTMSVQDPSFGIWGVATGLTGAHPDILCLDDPISYERMESHGDWFNVVNEHITSLIPVLLGNGLRIFVGTRYGDGDHFGTQLRKHGIASVAGMEHPSLKPTPNGIWHVYFLAARDIKNKSNYKQGQPTLPEVWSHKDLLIAENENSEKYWSQLMNEPHEGIHVPLRRPDIERLWIEPKDVPNNLRVSFHIDTAFLYKERQRRGDESVITIWGHSRDGSGDVYFLEGWGSSDWSAEQFSDRLVLLLQKYRASGKWPFILTDEKEAFGKAGNFELTLQAWCHAAGIPSPYIALLTRSFRTKKTPRILAAASFWKEGKVKLVRHAPGVERLIDQMLKIGTSEHDDWADAAADVFDKEVYQPMRRLHSMNDEVLIRPFDDELKDAAPTIGELIRRERANRKRLSEAPYDLIV